MAVLQRVRETAIGRILAGFLLPTTGVALPSAPNDTDGVALANVLVDSNGAPTGTAENPFITAAGAAASGGTSVYSAPGGTGNALITNTPVLVSAGAHSIYGLAIPNTNTADVWLQVFNAATAGAVTLGTTVPLMSVRIPGNGTGAAANAAFWEEKYASDGRIAFALGIVIAATTTATGPPLPEPPFKPQ